MDALVALGVPGLGEWLVILVVVFVLMAVSLIVSSCLGVYMAFQYKRDRRVIIGLLAAGVVLPILFLIV